MAKTFGIPYWGEESAKVGKFYLYCFFLDSVPKTGWMLFLAEIKIWEDDSLTLKSVLITWYGFPPNFIQPLLKLL